MLTGLFFLLVMEFMYKIQIFGDMGAFLFTPVIQIPFLAFAYFTSGFFDERLGMKDWKEPFYYIIYGLIGLIPVEWVLCGNSPWGNPQAVQLIMFTYWGGSVVFSRMVVDPSVGKVKRWTSGYFLLFTSAAFVLGFLIPEGDRFGWVILMSLIGYGLMNVFFVWYFLKKFS